MTQQRTERELRGWHVAAMFCGGFGIIIAVNLTLAFNAVATFPGLEVKNSYVASQDFDAARSAQNALGWTATARVGDGEVRLGFSDANGRVVRPATLDATLGRATHVQDDQPLDFAFDGSDHIAPADLAPGNWNLRLTATADDGTVFRQRLALWVPR